MDVTSQGDLGLVRFGVTRSRGCSAILETGCPLNRPLLTGVHEEMVVRVPRSLASGEVRFESTNPSVMTLDRSRLLNEGSTREFRLEVTARAPGSTQVKVSLPSGMRLDQLTVRVADATDLEVVDDGNQGQLSSDGRTLTLGSGDDLSGRGSRSTMPSTASITGWARDDSGRLYGNDAVVWTVADPEVALLSWGFMAGATVRDDRVMVQGLRPGTTVATVTAGAVSRRVTIVVSP